MGSKSGSGTIKTNLRKVKSGYDQEFTLQKGVSPAPIKQVKVTTEVQRVKAQILKDKLTPKVKESKGKIVGKVRQNWGEWKPVHQKIKTTFVPDKQYIKAKQREVGNIEYVFKNGKWVKVN